MPRFLPRLFVILLLCVVIWGHVGELCDQWDSTMQNANDVESSLVLISVCIGATLLLVRLLLRSPLAALTIRRSGGLVAPARDYFAPSSADVSPPVPIRI